MCIEFQQVCDLTDDCGDSSDELTDYCDDNGYIRNSFEEEDKPLGIFRREGGDSLQWERWMGPSPNVGTGPKFDHTTFSQKGHYLYINSSAITNPEERAFLVSERFQQSSEDGPDCVMTLNYFMWGSGLGSLIVTARSDDEQEDRILVVNGSNPDVMRNGWQRKRMIVNKSKIYSQYDITITASAMKAGEGDIAIDDITFSPECLLVPGSTSSSPSSSPSPAPCDPASQFTCGDGSCIPLPDFCNFNVDCPYPDQSDEITCPKFYSFENCSQGAAPSDCGWSNTIPDTLDWQVTSITDLQEEKVPHRPTQDYKNNTEGHFLFLKSLMGGSSAGVTSPVYSSSGTYCMFNFWIFMSGVNNFVLYPTLTHSTMGMLTTLDRLDLQQLEDGVWTNVDIGVGAHNDKFTLGFQVVSTGSGDWDAAVAVDAVEMFECNKPLPEENCLPGEYHCQTSRACVEQDMICDFADNCGDESDEDMEYQHCSDYTRTNFEDPLHPWGFFNETESSQDFKWLRGNGSIIAGTGPPFDHTTFGPMGHYLYINSSLGNTHDIAWLTTPVLIPDHANCSVRFYYHMHGAGVGNLTLYTQILGGDVLDLTQIWQRSGSGAGGVDLNRWVRAKVDIDTDTEAKIIWEASVGDAAMGNIAIDDVSFTPSCR